MDIQVTSSFSPLIIIILLFTLCGPSKRTFQCCVFLKASSASSIVNNYLVTTSVSEFASVFTVYQSHFVLFYCCGLRKGRSRLVKKCWKTALAGVAQQIEHWPANQRVAVSIPSLGHMPGLQARSPVGSTGEATTH